MLRWGRRRPRSWWCRLTSHSSKKKWGTTKSRCGTQKYRVCWIFLWLFSIGLFCFKDLTTPKPVFSSKFWGVTVVASSWWFVMSFVGGTYQGFQWWVGSGGWRNPISSRGQKATAFDAWSFTKSLHPLKQTWNLKIPHWKRRNIYKPSIFGFHVCFRGCRVSFFSSPFIALWMEFYSSPHCHGLFVILLTVGPRNFQDLFRTSIKKLRSAKHCRRWCWVNWA